MAGKAPLLDLFYQMSGSSEFLFSSSLKKRSRKLPYAMFRRQDEVKLHCNLLLCQPPWLSESKYM